MKIRKLRIAWSVIWGLLAVLLIVLWVRSYYWRDMRALEFFGWQLGVDPYCGTLCLFTTSEPGNRNYTVSRTMGGDPEKLWNDAFPHRVGCFGVNFERASGIACIVPYWFLTAGTITLGFATWFPWRFSLRTLLIATTLVAVVLGAVIYAVR